MRTGQEQQDAALPDKAGMEGEGSRNPTQQLQQQVAHARRAGVAGFLAGACSTLLLHPLDLVKTRLQVHPGPTSSTGRPPGAWQVARDVARAHGLRGLYRGVSPNLLGSTLSWGMYFWWFSLFKDAMREGTADGVLSPLQHLTASGAAGMLTSAFTNPLWVLKTRMVTQNAADPGAVPSLWRGLQGLWRQEGLIGMYRGYLPALIGTSHGAVQFMVYEELKKRLDTRSTLHYTLMAVVSKVVAAIVTYPYQVLRSRLHLVTTTTTTDATALRSTIRSLYAQQGVRAFYRGLGVHLVRVLPGTIVTFAVYEQLMKWFV